MYILHLSALKDLKKDLVYPALEIRIYNCDSIVFGFALANAQYSTTIEFGKRKVAKFSTKKMKKQRIYGLGVTLKYT
jgi:hypothetical protein